MADLAWWDYLDKTLRLLPLELWKRLMRKRAIRFALKELEVDPSRDCNSIAEALWQRLQGTIRPAVEKAPNGGVEPIDEARRVDRTCLALARAMARCGEKSTSARWAERAQRLAPVPPWLEAAAPLRSASVWIVGVDPNHRSAMFNQWTADLLDEQGGCLFEDPDQYDLPFGRDFLATIQDAYEATWPDPNRRPAIRWRMGPTSSPESAITGPSHGLAVSVAFCALRDCLDLDDDILFSARVRGQAAYPVEGIRVKWQATALRDRRIHRFGYAAATTEFSPDEREDPPESHAQLVPCATVDAAVRAATEAHRACRLYCDSVRSKETEAIIWPEVLEDSPRDEARAGRRPWDDVLAELAATRDAVVEIVGEVGQGKSFLLRCTARYVVETQPPTLSFCVPLPLLVRRLQEQYDQGLLDEATVSRTLVAVAMAPIPSILFTPTALRWFQSRVQAGAAWLLLDGLDEVPAANAAVAQRVLTIIGSWQGRIMVALQPESSKERASILGSPGLEPGRRFELAPWSLDQQERLAKRFAAPETLLNLLRTDLSIVQSVRGPLLLRMLHQALEDWTSLPPSPSRSEIYERVWHVMFGARRVAELLPILGDLAVEALRKCARCPSVGSYDELLDWARHSDHLPLTPESNSNFDREARAQSWCREITDPARRFLISEPAGERFVFYHRSLVDALAGNALARLWATSRARTGTSEMLQFAANEEWRDALLFASAYLKNDSDWESWLCSLRDPDGSHREQRLCLAAESLAEIPSGRRERRAAVIEQVTHEFLDLWRSTPNAGSDPQRGDLRRALAALSRGGRVDGRPWCDWLAQRLAEGSPGERLEVVTLLADCPAVAQSIGICRVLLEREPTGPSDSFFELTLRALRGVCDRGGLRQDAPPAVMASLMNAHRSREPWQRVAALRHIGILWRLFPSQVDDGLAKEFVSILLLDTSNEVRGTALAELAATVRAGRLPAHVTELLRVSVGSPDEALATAALRALLRYGPRVASIQALAHTLVPALGRPALVMDALELAELGGTAIARQDARLAPAIMTHLQPTASMAIITAAANALSSFGEGLVPLISDLRRVWDQGDEKIRDQVRRLVERLRPIITRDPTPWRTLVTSLQRE